MKKEQSVEKKEEKLNFDFNVINGAISSLKKTMGEDIFVNAEEKIDWDRVPTSSPTLGWIFGKGGTPVGGILEFIGPESGGKTLIAQNIVADFQRAGKFAVYIDTEYSFNPEYAKIQGVDISNSKFALLHPDTGEDAFEAAIELAKTKQVGIIVVDSLATCLPTAEDNGTMTDQQMGAQARMIGKGLRKLLPAAGKSGTTIILVSQWRSKIGVVFGDPRVSSGGGSPKYYSCIRCEVSKGEKDKVDDDSEDMKGIGIKIKNIKNKTSIPFRKGELYCSFTTGLDKYSEYCDFAVSYEIIKKSGAWFSYNNNKIGQGRDNAIQFLKDNLNIFDEVKKSVDAKLAGDATDLVIDAEKDISTTNKIDLAATALE
jgi:recombination protein RecA